MSTNPFLRRRQFLGQTALVSSLALIGLTTDVLGAKKKGRPQKKRRRKNKRSRRARVLDLSEEHFEDLVGEHFKVSGAQRPVQLKLVEVREHDHHTDDQLRPIHIRQEPFSLLFVAPDGATLRTGIHEVEHPNLGEFNLFLHEVGADQDEETTHFEAVFN